MVEEEYKNISDKTIERLCSEKLKVTKKIDKVESIRSFLRSLQKMFGFKYLIDVSEFNDILRFAEEELRDYCFEEKDYTKKIKERQKKIYNRQKHIKKEHLGDVAVNHKNKKNGMVK